MMRGRVTRSRILYRWRCGIRQCLALVVHNRKPAEALTLVRELGWYCDSLRRVKTRAGNMFYRPVGLRCPDHLPMKDRCPVGGDHPALRDCPLCSEADRARADQVRQYLAR